MNIRVKDVVTARVRSDKRSVLFWIPSYERYIFL